MSSSTPPSLLHRTAIVTGAGRGIGLAIAQTLAGAGAQIVLLGRDLPRLQQAAASLQFGFSEIRAHAEAGFFLKKGRLLRMSISVPCLVMM